MSIKAKRLNLVPSLREALFRLNVSSVQVVEAVNAALGSLELLKSESSLGDGKVKLKDDIYSVTEKTSDKFTGAINLPLKFDALNSALAKVDKISVIKFVEIPEEFSPWLNKMAKKPAQEKEPADEDLSPAALAKTGGLFNKAK